MNSGGGALTVKARIDQVVDEAIVTTGLSQFGGDTWREGLEVLVRSAQAEARFNDYGEQAFYSSLVQPLVNRLRIEDWYARHPEIDDQDVEVEFLGVGFPGPGRRHWRTCSARTSGFGTCGCGRR